MFIYTFYPIQDKWTALHTACMNGHDEVVKILLQAGIDPNIQDNVSNRKLLLTHSLLDMHTLCDVCMFVSLPIQSGWTVLQEACWNGHDEIVKILLQAGADLNIAILTD